MGSNPLVSCVCPTFNRPIYLRHSVELFLAQTWKNAELIIVDDSDPSKKADLPRDPRIKIYPMKERLTIGEKHNLGNAAAQGDAIAFWDDDDYFSPRRLVRQLDPLLSGEAELVGFQRNLVLEAGPIPRFVRIKPWPVDVKKWVGNGATNLRVEIHDGSAVYSRRAADAGLNFPDQTGNEKVAFLNLLASSGFKWKAIKNDDLFVYVRHGRNTWQYREDLVHFPATRPSWFPQAELDFYRRPIS